ncbi:hypothetical protein GJ496_007617 [Pomphorhynchus laevis]|nr:hypothetical protein GJ496_007617 [Pomphorhynchus laevis]
MTDNKYSTPVKCYHFRQHSIKYGCYQLDSTLLTQSEPTVSDLAFEIRRLMGVPLNEQAIAHEGKRLDLEFDKKLMDLQVPDGAEIVLRRKVLYEPVCASDRIFGHEN